MGVGHSTKALDPEVEQNKKRHLRGMSFVEMFPEQISERVYQIATSIEDDDILLKLLRELNAENKARRTLEGRCRLLKDDNDRFNMFYIRGKNSGPHGGSAVPGGTTTFVNFDVSALTSDDDIELRNESTATLPLSTTVPDILKCIEAREFRLAHFQATLRANRAALLTVDAVDVADEFTAFSVGRRAIPLLFDLYCRCPKSLATFLWNFNIESSTITLQFRQQREEVLSTFGRCPGFIQAMSDIWQGVDDGPEVVVWVLIVLWPLSPEFRTPRFVNLAELLETQSNLVGSVIGYQTAMKLRAVRTGVAHEVVIWGTHRNDPQQYRYVDILPIQAELRRTELPVGQLSRLKFDVKHDDAEGHLDRHFRLLREDQVANLRSLFTELLTKGSIKRNSVALNTNCTVSRVEDLFYVKATLTLLKTHPLVPKKTRDMWLRESKSFFAKDTVVFLRCGDHIELGVVARQTTAAVTILPNVAPTAVVTVSVRFSSTFVAIPPGAGRRADYVLHSSGVQWNNVSLVLKSLQNTHTLPFESQILRLKDKPSKAPIQLSQQLQAKGLTDRQHQAITKAITHKMTLIQGPPGTGKTFVGTRLVEALTGAEAEVGSIVIILAYTNHALDQLLLRIHALLLSKLKHEEAVDGKFIRLGIGTKEDAIRKFMTQLGGDVAGGEYGKLKRRQMEAVHALTSKPRSKAFIAASLYRRYECLTLTQLEMEKITNSNPPLLGNPGVDFLWDLWCSGKINRVNDQSFKHNFKWFDNGPLLLRRLEVFRIPAQDRQDVIRRVNESPFADMARATQAKVSADEQMDAARQRARVQSIPSKVRIVGATTSFGAKNQAFLKALTTRYPNSTLLIEEAGEILEGHILACLEDKLRRVVMIGDHKQLPPKVEQYIFQRSSGKGYDLNCSMFQRMIEGGYPYIALDEQHRMFPTLSQILRKLSYPGLRDGAEITAQKVTPIPGFEHQMLFFDHEFKEAGGEVDGEVVSKCNSKEAEFVVRAATYLSQQPRVKFSQMVILTPYLGQVVMLRESIRKAGFRAALNDRDVAEMSDHDEDDDDDVEDETDDINSIRVSTVDNFQGEEADYVFVSLVRCNKEGIIGWLKEDPRITVLLSRAKKGLLLFGSRSTITAKRSSWDLVFGELGERRCQKTLSLHCSRHNQYFTVSKVTDFDRLPHEGGCNQICAVKMGCGHHCPEKCHFGDRAHRQAMQNCKRLREVTCSKGHVSEAECANSRTKSPEEISASICTLCSEIRRVEAQAVKARKTLEREIQRDRQRREVERRRLEADLLRRDAELKKLSEHNIEEAAREATRAKMDVLQRNIDEAKVRMQQQVDRARQITEEEANRVRNHMQQLGRRTDEELARIREEGIRAIAATHDRHDEERRNEAQRTTDALTSYNENRERNDILLREEMQNNAALTDDERLNRIVQCQSCDDDLPVREAKVCRGAMVADEGRHCHYFHDDCFDLMLEAQINEPQQALEGEVLCSYCKAAGVVPPEAAIIPSFIIHRFASATVAEKYDKSRLDAQIAKGEREGEARVRRQMEAESERDRLFRELSEAQNAKCPRCNHVFFDYNGCSALECATCKCGFCALCLKDCGTDAHQHVANCHLNPKKGDVFVRQDVFQVINARRGRQVAFDKLTTATPDVQEHVWGRLFDGQPMPTERP